MTIPKRPADRTLSIAPKDLAHAMSPWDAKMMAATKLRAAGFRFQSYDPVRGEFRLAAPWDREVDWNTSANTYRQWDEEEPHAA